LLGDAFSKTATWTQETAALYLQRVKHITKGLGVIVVLGLLAYGLGVATGQSWLLSLSVLVLGVCVALFLMVTSPLWAIAVKLGGQFQSVATVFKAIGFVLLWSFLLALAMLIVPVTAKTAVVLPLGTGILALLAALTHQVPNPAFLFGKVVTVMAMAIVVSVMTTLFPKTIGSLSSAGSGVDSWLADVFGGLGTAVKKQKRLQVTSLEELRSIVFFDPQTRKAIVWYTVNSDGEIELYGSGGFHPLTGEELKPVTPVVIQQLERKLKDRQRVAAEAERAAKAKMDADVQTAAPLQKENAAPAQAQGSEPPRIKAETESQEHRRNPGDVPPARDPDTVRVKATEPQRTKGAQEANAALSVPAPAPVPASAPSGYSRPQPTPAPMKESREVSGTADIAAVSGQKGIDQIYNERATAECSRGALGLICRETLKLKLCDGKWTDAPPPGDSLCKQASRTTN
jgi:hypothetical protein